MSKKWLAILVVLVAVTLITLSFSKQRTPVKVVTARLQPITEYIEEQGKTTLPRIYHITMPLNGRLQEVELEEGSEVSKGQTIAQMDISDLQTTVTIAQAKVDALASRITLNKYNKLEKTGLEESKSIIASVQDTVKSSEKKAEASQAKYEFAKWNFEQLEELYSQNGTNLQQLNEAKTTFIQSKVDHQSDKLNTSALRAIETATSLLPVYIRQYLGRKELSRDILLREKAGAEAELAQAKRNLARAKITSPIDGVVLKRHVVNERVLQAGTAILDLGNLSQLEVTADILSQEAIVIRPGNEAEIYCGSLETPLHGQVKQVKPSGFTKLSSLGVEQQRVPVVIAIDAQDLQKLRDKYHGLGVNYRVRVRIYTRKKNQALQIPRTCLFLGDNGKWQIFVVKQGNVYRQDVKTGLMNEEHAEILEGISEGEHVVISPESSLQEGMAVEKSAKNLGD